MKCLVTGGCGFIGSNVASAAAARGNSVRVIDNLSRHGSEQNLAWLREMRVGEFSRVDTRDRAEMERVVREFQPDVIFHFAGQVAMTTSVTDPRADFEINAIGGHNVLEAFRKQAPGAVMLYSSTNKVYGEFEGVHYDEQQTRYVARGYPRGFDESMRLDFQSPYGCSKGTVDQYALDYARVYGLRTVVFRHSTVFGGRQFATYDQGWIGWFVRQALETRKHPKREPFTISGDGKQVRDILFIDDLIGCYFGAIAHIDAAKGQAFNIGGGAENSLSLLELFAWLEAELGVKLNYTHLPWRQSDQRVFIANTAKAERLLEWRPGVSLQQGLKRMVEWMEKNV